MSIHATNLPKGTDSKAPETAASPVQSAEIHELLANERRYLAIKYLSEHGPSDLQDIAEYVATQLEGRPIERGDDDYKKYMVSVHQTHLDVLKKADVVEFKRKRGVIELGEDAEDVLAYMPSEQSLAGRALDKFTSLF